jgi:ferredoxin-thioredoxin reductase catalytic subunit
LAELAHVNPAQTFPTLLGGAKAAAGPLPEDLRRLAARFVGGSGQGAGPVSKSGPEAELTAAAKLCETLAPVQAAQGYVFNPDSAWTLKALAGILVNEARYGYGSCPGRLATGRREGDRAIICPCAFRDEDVAKYGHCHCRLYFNPRTPGGPALPVPDRWLFQI